MIITLAIIGIMFVVYGSYVSINNKKPNFIEFLEKAEKRDNANSIIKKMNDMDDKINHLVNLVENLGKEKSVLIIDDINNEEEEVLKDEVAKEIAKEIIVEDNKKDIEKRDYTRVKSVNDGNKELMNKISNMAKENKSIEEIANTLKLGKGEVLFLQNLSKKNYQE